jgi:serine/threonine protein kinase
MPFEIHDTDGVRLGQFQPATEDARELLFDITKNLQGRSGVLRLVQPPEGKMAYERATWSPFGIRGGAAQLDTTRFVQKLFYSAYQPAIDRLSEGEEKIQKQELLDKLVVDFTQAAVEKNHLFGKTTLRTYFNRAERELTSEPHRLEVAEGRAAQDDTLFLARIVEDKAADSQPSLVPDIDHFDQAGNYHPPVVVHQPNQELPNLQSVHPQQDHLPQPLLTQQPVVVRLLPPFTPTKNSSSTTLFQSITGLDLRSAKSFDKGGMGEVFEVPSQNGTAPQIFKKLLIKNDSDITKSLIANDLRNMDGTSIYLQSGSQSIPGLVAATDIFIAAIEKNSGVAEFHHVPLNNPPEAKRYLRELQKNNSIAVVGQLMPKAKGRSLDGLDLTGPSPERVAHRQAIAQQMMTTLHAYTKRGFADRDIKPDNLIYDEGTRTLAKIDNGLMVKFSKDPSKRTSGKGPSGTSRYLAPQKFSKYGPEVDAYELAMTLAEIKYGTDFIDAASERYANPRKLSGGIDPNYGKYRNKPGFSKDTEFVFLAKFAQSKNQHKIMNQVQGDLKKNDPEAKFIEKLMEISFTKPNFAAPGGRQEIYADYYRNLDDLMNDPYLKQNP